VVLVIIFLHKNLLFVIAMKKVLFCLLSIFTLLFSSCNRNFEDPKPINYDYSNAFPLKAGNYWVYQATVTDAARKVYTASHVDSVWIASDTIINGKVHYIQMSTYTGPLKMYLSDSSGYVVSQILQFRSTLFAKHETSDTLEGNSNFMRIMYDPGKRVTVNAGTFETVASIILVKHQGSGNHHGQPESSDYSAPMFNEEYMLHEKSEYANNIGLVKRTYYDFGGMVEDKLVRYKVQ
jgi:hypothetical protein